MMMIINRNPNGLPFIFSILLLIVLSIICLSSASTSDTLIIRHGRSRVRHSSEKNHIRWGLQAFDNLTLYDYDYENSNGTNGSNETLFDMNGAGGNQTFFGTETFGYYSSEITFNNGNNNNSEIKLISTSPPMLSGASNNNNNNNRWSASTSSIPAKKKLAKKQIMENIRKNVEEGLEYLRTHAHLTHPTAVMPSEKSILQLQQQQQIFLKNDSNAQNVVDIQNSNNSKQNKSKYLVIEKQYETSMASNPPPESILISKLLKTSPSSSASTYYDGKLTQSNNFPSK